MNIPFQRHGIPGGSGAPVDPVGQYVSVTTDSSADGNFSADTNSSDNANSSGGNGYSGELTFPRQYARTQRFTLGAPRDFSISPDGKQILFARSRSGTDPVNCLYALDVETRAERLVADPLLLATGSDEDLPPEEQARRERARESSGGIVRYTTDKDQSKAVFDLGGHLYVCEVESGAVAPLATAGLAVDPRIDPTGRRVAYVAGEALHVVGIDGSGENGAGKITLCTPENENITYGLADFIAGEEMDRYEGYWWSPDGERLLVARVDSSPVQRIYITDPAHPERKPNEVAYPFAGTDNATVSLSIVAADGSGTPLPVEWDNVAFEYLCRVDWSPNGLHIQVQSRDQRHVNLLRVDEGTGATAAVREDSDPEWLEIVDGLPAFLADGSLVWTVDEAQTRRLLVAGEAVTPADLVVRGVLDVDADRVLFSASTEPTEAGVFEWTAGAGISEIFPPEPAARAVRTALARGGTTVVVERSLDHDEAKVSVLVSGLGGGGASGEQETSITSFAQKPLVDPRPTIIKAGERQIRTALLLPTGHIPGQRKLPVLLEPYGGPGMQRVMAARAGYTTSQWFADQGFAVVIADGRGTPGRGREWLRSIYLDMANPVLDDQVAGLEAAAAWCQDLDLERVAIRGWSFGGYLSALAVLRRPDVFHVAVAGAPVTDWALYDTHYTERYLGTPEADPEAYAGSCLLDDAASLTRPLMIIHGLADDNVLVANSLQLSARLTAAGKQHTVLPLVGVTHMTTQEEVAENLLLLQLRFIRAGLGIAAEG